MRTAVRERIPEHPGATTLLWTALCVVGLATSGCATRHGDAVAFVKESEAEVSTGTYIVRPPDVITIHAPRTPEIDGASQMIRSDGKIVLRLLGELEVAGLTTSAIADKIKAQLARYYVDPEVMVQVSGYNSQFYYIFGEVTHPGPVRFTGRDTLLMAMAQAQPTFFAWKSQIRVTRPADEKGERKTIIFDLDKVVAEGDTSINFLLQEGDIIEVPPTPLAWLGHRVREVLYPVEPVYRAYTLPAGGINAHRTYQDEFGGSNDDTDSFRRRFAR